MINEPTSFDPFFADSADTRSILFNIFEGLVKPTKDGELMPAVAESYETSDDAKTYTFVLRNDIKFHNENLVTMDDVIYSVNQAIDAKVAGYDNIMSVEAMDENTIKIQLKEADNEFLPYLTTAIVPKDYTEQATKPIGTGPYKMEAFTEQQSLVMVKNKNYWQEGLPYLDKVTYKSVADGAGALLELKAGTVDLLSVEYSVIQQLDSKEYSIEETSSNSVQLLALNNNYEPLKDIRVRQAISYVVDSQEIMQTVNKGYAKRAGSPVIPALAKLYDKSLDDSYKKDVGKAKQLMEQAGYPNGFDLKITVPSIYQVHIDTAQVIINQLKEIKINATIETVDWSTWLSNVYTDRQYEATVVSVDGKNITAKSYLGRYVSNADNNFVNYHSTEYDDLYAAAVKEPDEIKRNDLYKQAQQLLSRDAASVYIEDISRLYAFRTKFTGITNYPLYVLDLSTIRKSE
jgi:peptide/nickel transport system substrate-binding protein